MAGGDSEYQTDRSRTGSDDAAIWRRFKGVAGDDVKIGALQRLKIASFPPDSFSAHLQDLLPANQLRGEALMQNVWRIGMERLTLDPGETPWSASLPSKHFADRLHHFDWLPDLMAQGEAGLKRADRFVQTWLDTHGGFNSFSWRLEPTTVRCWNWFRCSESIFEIQAAEQSKAWIDSLVRQIRYVADNVDASVDPVSRWHGALILVTSAVCLDKGEGLSEALSRLDGECTAQILPDGGHVSRSPSRGLSCLLQLQMIRDLLARGNLEVPEFLDKWIPRMGAMVAFFRAGDGGLSPFNDGDESRPEVVQTAIDLLPTPPRRFTFAPKSGFQKLEKEGLRLILDCGEAPARPFGDYAHAGALGFELSDGPARLVTSCGFSAEVNLDWQAAVRRTGAHSTLVLAGRDSSSFATNEESRLLSAAGPDGISAKRLEEDDEIWLDAQHGGYKAPYGLLHRRRLFMSGDGLRVTGEDSLVRPISQPPTSDRKFIGFEIRFHLHPTVTAMMGRDAIRLICDDGSVWRFKTSHEGARLERTVYLARGVVERPEQIVMAGYADPNGDGQQPPNCVRWAFLKETGK